MTPHSASSLNSSGLRSGATPPGWRGQRALEEPVLSTADQELDGQAATQQASAAASPEPSAAARAASAWHEVQQLLARQVSERPARTALLAVGAGALAAWMLGQSLRGRRGRD